MRFTWSSWHWKWLKHYVDITFLSITEFMLTYFIIHLSLQIVQDIGKFVEVEYLLTVYVDLNRDDKRKYLESKEHMLLFSEFSSLKAELIHIKLSKDMGCSSSTGRQGEPFPPQAGTVSTPGAVQNIAPCCQVFQRPRGCNFCFHRNWTVCTSSKCPQEADRQRPRWHLVPLHFLESCYSWQRS